jgi:superfamily II DNA or RNA helicase
VVTKKKKKRVREPLVRITNTLELGPDWPRGAITTIKRALDYANPARQKLIAIGKKRAAEALPHRIQHYEERDDGTLLVPRGATAKVKDACTQHGLEALWLDQRLELPPVDFDLRPGAQPVELWDHQREVVEACRVRENCLVRAATGSGKTDAALELIRHWRQPTLVIVWTADLVQQWIERICLRWGWTPDEVGIIGGGKRRQGLVTIALQQSLKPAACVQLVPKFGCVLVDECFVSAPVLMADGTTKPIEHVRVGDRVALGGVVRATSRRFYTGPAWQVGDAIATGEHPYATGDGWKAIAEVTNDDELFCDPQANLRSLQETDAPRLPTHDAQTMRPWELPSGSLSRLREGDAVECEGWSCGGVRERWPVEQRQERGDRAADRFGVCETARSQASGMERNAKGDVGGSGASREDGRGDFGGSDEAIHSCRRTRAIASDGDDCNRGWSHEAFRRTSLWQWKCRVPVGTRALAGADADGLSFEPRHLSRHGSVIGTAARIQDRPGESDGDGRGRGGWLESFAEKETRCRREKDALPRVAWLEGLPLPGAVRLERRRANHRRLDVHVEGIVHNLTTDTGVYVAGGRLVHNCQRASSRTLREAVAVFPARYRVGLSADERRKDRMDFVTHDLFGAVACEVKRQGLEKKKILCPVDFVMVPTEFRMPELDDAPPEERRAIRSQLYQVYMERIAKDEERAQLTADLALHLHQRGESVLVFCNRIELAKQLAEFLTNACGAPCGLLLGSGEQSRGDFAATKQALSDGTLRLAVGSAAIYQATDIPRLTAGVVVTPTGSNRQLIEQQVGRLRRSANGKTKARLYYLWDEAVVPEHLDNLARWYGAAAVKVARTRIPE